MLPRRSATTPTSRSGTLTSPDVCARGTLGTFKLRCGLSRTRSEGDRQLGAVPWCICLLRRFQIWRRRTASDWHGPRGVKIEGTTLAGPFKAAEMEKSLHRGMSRRKIEPKLNGETSSQGLPRSERQSFSGADLSQIRNKVRAKTQGTAESVVSQLSGGPESTLSKEIAVLETDNFNADAYITSKCQTMSEASIRRLCGELSDYKRLSADEMRRTVYANYPSFIRSAKEISDLEGELRSIHTFLTAQAQVLRSLSERPSLASALVKAGPDARSAAGDEDLLAGTQRDSGLLGAPEHMVVCLAERNFPGAIQILEQCEGEIAMLRSRMRVSGAVAAPGTPTAEELDNLEVQLQERSADLLQLLADVTTQPSITRTELREAVGAIAKLGDAKRAHTLLLDAHKSRLRNLAGVLRPIGVSYSVSYTHQISRIIFSGISLAADDSARVFGDSQEIKSELVLWAHKEAEWCAALLQRYVLVSAAASGGLRLAAECVQIAVGYCTQLEDRPGIALAPVLLRLVRPSVEQALEANIRRIEDSVGAMAAADDWSLENPQSASRFNRMPTLGSTGGASTSSTSSIRLTSSARRLYAMVQDFLEDVVPIVNLQLTTQTLEGLGHLLTRYLAILNKARAPIEESEGYDSARGIGGHEALGESPVSRAVTEKQQLALIANATALSEELPRVAMKLTQPGGAASATNSRFLKEHRRSSGGETRRQQLQQWRRGLAEEVENFKMGICLAKAMKLLFPEAEQEGALLPNLYFFLDEQVEPGAPLGGDSMPSQTLQDFLFTVLSINESAQDVLVGRDRLVLNILTQFALALLTLVCHDRAWEDVQVVVGPVGLQKFLLDMTFLKEVASKYHFSTRRLQQEVDSSMDRARNFFDPDRVCPGDAIFQEAAQAAIAQLLKAERE